MRGGRLRLLALWALTASAFLPARARAGEAEPAPVVVRDRNDAALARVLRSRCTDGLAEVRALVGDPAAPWAETVARLCDDILRAPAAEPSAPAAVDEVASANEGRGRLVFWSALYGVWLGIAADVLFDVNGRRSEIVPPMVAVAATLTTSLLITSQHPLTTGQAWTIISGLDYATADGALWGAGLGLSTKGVVGTAIGTSAAATAIATWVAVDQRPKAGDIELVRSSMLWGTTAGLLGLATVAPSNTSGQTAWKTGAIAMDLALVAGIGLADRFDLSRNRVLLIDAGAVGGGLAGFGLSWLIVGGASGHGHAVAGGTLAGLLAGIGVAAIASRHVDAPDREARALPPPALLARDADGRWTFNVPAPVPLLAPGTTRLAGATLTALGGLF